MPEQMQSQPSSIEELHPKMQLGGTITRTELYGAFVDLGLLGRSCANFGYNSGS